MVHRKASRKKSKKMTHFDIKYTYSLFISIVIIQMKEGKEYEKESMDFMCGNGSDFGRMQQCE